MGPTGIVSSSNRERRKNRWWGVRVNLAGLIFCDVKFNAPKEKAAARVLEVEEEEVFDVVGTPPDTLVDEAVLVGCRLICSALASAFSWVLTKLAKFCD